MKKFTLFILILSIAQISCSHEAPEWTHAGMFTLIDDDACDEFIPSSYAGQSIRNSDKKVGGYFSLLYPFLKSLEVKHNISLTCGIAAEGHRIGLTRF